MEYTELLRALASLILVLGLIAGLAWMWRKFGSGTTIGGTLSGNPQKRRLSVQGSLALDGRNRAVLVRRDDVEHLVVIGPGPVTVVESDIDVSALKTAESK